MSARRPTFVALLPLLLLLLIAWQIDEAARSSDLSTDTGGLLRRAAALTQSLDWQKRVLVFEEMTALALDAGDPRLAESLADILVRSTERDSANTYRAVSPALVMAGQFARRGQSELASLFVRRAEAILQAYPPRYSQELWLGVGEVLYAIGDTTGAVVAAEKHVGAGKAQDRLRWLAALEAARRRDYVEAVRLQGEVQTADARYSIAQESVTSCSDPADLPACRAGLENVPMSASSRPFLVALLARAEARFGLPEPARTHAGDALAAALAGTDDLTRRSTLVQVIENPAVGDSLRRKIIELCNPDNGSRRECLTAWARTRIATGRDGEVLGLIDEARGLPGSALGRVLWQSYDPDEGILETALMAALDARAELAESLMVRLASPRSRSRVTGRLAVGLARSGNAGAARGTARRLCDAPEVVAEAWAGIIEAESRSGSWRTALNDLHSLPARLAERCPEFPVRVPGGPGPPASRGVDPVLRAARLKILRQLAETAASAELHHLLERCRSDDERVQVLVGLAKRRVRA